MDLQCNEAGQTRLTVEISNFVGYCTELSRSVNNEKQQQYQMEIEQLRKEKEELELQLEICRIERDDLAKKNQQSDAPQTVLETRAVQEQIRRRDAGHSPVVVKLADNCVRVLSLSGIDGQAL